MAKTPQIPVLHVFHNNDAHLYPANVREDKVYLKGEKVAQFTNRGVFTVKDYTGRKPRKLKMVIYLDGKANTVGLQDPKTPAENDNATENLQVIPETKEKFFEPLTDNDRKTVVKREIAKQLGKFKPMETWQFIAIMALLGVNLALQFIF